MADTTQKENIMGTQKMSKLILFTGIPLMVSLFINSLYNFVDSMFVSQVSEKALTALSLAAPVQLLVSALGLGNAVGLNAVISKALGRKDVEDVRRAADAAIFIALCSWVLISMILTMARQAVLPLVFAGIFSRLGNLNLLWIGFILAEFLGIPAAMCFWRKGCRRMEGGELQ